MRGTCYLKGSSRLRAPNRIRERPRERYLQANHTWLRQDQVHLNHPLSQFPPDRQHGVSLMRSRGNGLSSQGLSSSTTLPGLGCSQHCWGGMEEKPPILPCAPRPQGPLQVKHPGPCPLPPAPAGPYVTSAWGPPHAECWFHMETGHVHGLMPPFLAIKQYRPSPPVPLTSRKDLTG